MSYFNKKIRTIKNIPSEKNFKKDLTLQHKHAGQQYLLTINSAQSFFRTGFICQSEVVLVFWVLISFFSCSHFWGTIFLESGIISRKYGNIFIDCCENDLYELISLKYFRNCFHISQIFHFVYYKNTRK